MVFCRVTLKTPLKALTYGSVVSQFRVKTSPRVFSTDCEPDVEVYQISYLDELPVTARGFCYKKRPCSISVIRCHFAWMASSVRGSTVTAGTCYVDWNVLLTKTVFRGLLGQLFLKGIVIVSWRSYIRSILWSFPWTPWRGDISGGQDWMLLKEKLHRGLPLVIFVFFEV